MLLLVLLNGCLFVKNPTGVFVLHNKIKRKEGTLPNEIMNGNYFAAEEQEDIWLAYPWDALDIDAHTEKALAEEADEAAAVASTTLYANGGPHSGNVDTNRTASSLKHDLNGALDARKENGNS